MKKLLSAALIAVILSSTMVDTMHAAIERSTIRRSVARRRAPVKRRSLTGKKRTLPTATGKTSPEQLKKAALQAERDTKKLQIDAKKSETGKVPEKTIVADAKKVEANINLIEQKLANLRTWSGDVMPGGYSLEEKNEATIAATPLIKEAESLKKGIAETKKKIGDITTSTYLGFGTPTVNPGKEREYAQYMGLIKISEARLAQLEPAIAKYEIIMGQRRSNALKAAYAAMAVAALVAGDIASGYAISGTAYSAVSTVASNVAYYTPAFIKTPLSAIWGYARGTAPRVAIELTLEQTENANNLAQSIENDIKKAPAGASDADIYQIIKKAVIARLNLQTGLSFGGKTLNVITDTLFQLWKEAVKNRTKWAASSLTALLGGSTKYSEEELLNKTNATKAELKKRETKTPAVK